jgi:hypothetical protein
LLTAAFLAGDGPLAASFPLAAFDAGAGRFLAFFEAEAAAALLLDLALALPRADAALVLG